MKIKSNPFFAKFVGLYLADMHKIGSSGRIVYDDGDRIDVEIDLQHERHAAKADRAMQEILLAKPVQGLTKSITESFADYFLNDPTKLF
jgi:hypothetical protein